MERLAARDRYCALLASTPARKVCMTFSCSSGEGGGSLLCSWW